MRRWLSVLTTVLAAVLVLSSCAQPSMPPPTPPPAEPVEPPAEEAPPAPVSTTIPQLEWRETFGARASDIVITPDGSRLYVTCTGTNNVVVIDTATDEVIDVIELCSNGFHGEWPGRLDITPDGKKIYTANALSHNISIIDTTTNQVVGTIEIDDAVHDVVIRPDGKQAYAEFEYMGDNPYVCIIDVGSDRIVDRISLPRGCVVYSMVTSHDSSRLFVVCHWGPGDPFKVYIVDTETSEISDYIEIGALPMEASCEGRLGVSLDDIKLYLTSGWNVGGYTQPEVGLNKVFVIDLKTKTIANEILVTGGPAYLRVSLDGRLAYVSTTSAQKIFVIDLVEEKVVGELSWGEVRHGEAYEKTDLRNIVFHPEGKRAYITAWDGDAILVADLDSNRIIRAIELSMKSMAMAMNLAITPDGKQVYAARQPITGEPWYSRIFVIDARTNSLVDEIAVEPVVADLCIDPGGLLYAVTPTKVMVLDTATNEVVNEIPLPQPPRHPSSIALIPSQGKAYVTNWEGSEVFVIDLESSKIVNQIDVGLGARTVIISPNESLAYVSRGNTPHGKGGLVIIDTASDKVIDRMDNPPEEWGLIGAHDPLAITPDGKYLLWEFSQPKIKIIELETNQVIKAINMFEVLGHPTFEMGMAPHGPAFSSDGSRVYFVLGDCYLLMIVDTSTWEMIDYISGIGSDPQSVVITPDDRFVYILNRESVDVSVVDLESRTVIAKIPLCSSKD